MTGADGIMIGRGALGNPEIFSEICGIQNTKSKQEIIFKYLDYMLEFFDPKRALLESRAHIMFFLKGLKSSTKIKSQIMQAKSIHEVKCIINDFFNKF